MDVGISGVQSGAIFSEIAPGTLASNSALFLTEDIAQNLSLDSQAIISQSIPLNVSSDQLLKSFPQNKIPLSEVAQHLKKNFENQPVIWIHEENWFARKTACKEYIDTHSKYYEGNVHWINAGESGETLVSEWKKLGMKLNSKWKNALPDDYPRTFEESWKNSPYLILVENVKISHFSTLTSFMQQVKGKNHHYLVLSDKQLNEESFTLDVDPNWFANQNHTEEIHELIKICISYRGKDQSYHSLQSLLDVLEKKEPELVTVLKDLSMFAPAPMKKDFIELISSSNAYTLLEKYKMMFVENDLLTVNRDILDVFKDAQFKDMKKIDRLTRLLRKNLESPFRDSKKDWLISPIQEFFSHTRTNRAISPETFILLASLMLDIGHYYTQNGHPLLAQEVTCDVRKAIESFVKMKGKRSSPSKPAEYIADLKSIHSILPYLYINCQYQIGRIYFYHQVPHEKMGSFAVLKHAKMLSACLNEGNSQPFLAVLIQRNGLLYHERDNKNFTYVIKEYQSLLDSEGIYKQMDYKSGNLLDLHIKHDTQHQETCLRYLIRAKIENNECVKKEVDQYRKVLENMTPKEKIVAFILLSDMLLKQGDFEQALAELSNLDFDTLSLNQKLDFLKVKMGCLCKLKQREDLKKAAQDYRHFAQDYYQEGQRAIYDAWVYENSQGTFNEQGFDYLKRLDLFIKEIGRETNVKILNYSLKEEKLTLDISASSPKIEVDFFQKIAEHFKNVVLMPCQGTFELEMSSEEAQAELSKILSGLWQPRQEKKRFPTSSQSQSQRKVEEHETANGIKLFAGKDRQLSIARPLVEFLKREGDWEGLKKEMEKPEDIVNGSSKYFSAQGYRLKMDRDKSGIYKKGSLDDSNLEFPQQETWSDDELDSTQLQDQLDLFVQQKNKQRARNQELLKTSSFYPYFENENKVQDKIDETFRKKTVEFEEKIAGKLGIDETKERLSRAFSDAISTENQENLREYAESYIDNKAIFLKEHGDNKTLKRLNKVDHELQSLRERCRYLELKKENMTKNRIYQQQQKKKEYCSDHALQELKESLAQVEEFSLVNKAKPQNLSKQTVRDHQRVANSLHFSRPHAFAYHTLKHQETPPFIYQEKTQDVVFSKNLFEENANRYLHNIQSLIEKEATLICSIPDQHESNTINYRYLKFTPFSGEINQILSLQKQIEQKGKIASSLQREVDNNGYLTEKIHIKEKKMWEARKQEEEKEKKELEKKLEALCQTSRVRACHFTVLASQKQSNDTYDVFIRTAFSKSFDIETLPKAQIAPLLYNDLQEPLSIEEEKIQET